jgi:MFS transporter, DHA1 family, staphyloferrin A biosynthesis exporter
LSDSAKRPEKGREPESPARVETEGTRPFRTSFERRRGFSLRNFRTFESLTNSAYRFYFFGMAGQWASMNMQMVTRSLLLYRLTGSGAMLGLMSLANAVPTLLLALFGGALADRVPKKLVIQIGQLASALISFSVAITLTTGYLSAEHAGSWWILMANSVLQGVVMALMMPSRQAIIPEVVRPHQVMNAVALNSLGMNTLRLIAPAIAGFIIDAFDFEAIFYAMTGLYLMAVVLTSFMQTKTPTTTVRVYRSNALRDIKEGLAYIVHNRIILSVLLLTLIIIVLSMPYQMMMPIFADDILKVGATGMGLLMSVSGVGAMVGSLLVASLPNRKRGVVLLLSSIVLGVGLAVFAFSRSMTLSLGTMIIVGLGQAGRQTLASTLLQSYSEEAYLGRVMSINMMDMGISSLGTFFTGILADSIGADKAIGGFAIGLVLIAVVSLFLFKRITRLD